MTSIPTRPYYSGSGKVIDLHNQATDMTGRVDVLVARTIKLVVERNSDPMLQMWYARFQPLLDAEIHSALSRINIKKTLINLGIAPPPVRKSTVKKVGDLRRGRKKRTGGTEL